MFEFLKTKRQKAKEVIGPFLMGEANRTHEHIPLFCEYCGEKTKISFSAHYNKRSGKVDSWKYAVFCCNHDGLVIYLADEMILLYHMEEHLPPEDFEKVLAAIEVLC